MRFKPGLLACEREKRKLAQEDLSAKTGVSRRTISTYENKHVGTLGPLELIIAYFNKWHEKYPSKFPLLCVDDFEQCPEDATGDSGLLSWSWLTKPQHPFGQNSTALTELTSELLFLVFLDRFDEGLWGHSLTSTAQSYGHPGDPGSITITYIVLATLKQFGLPDTADIRSDFFSYLKSRMSPSGAVGMRRRVGSTYVDSYLILEHRRHTAMAALFFLECNAIAEAIDCLTYVANCQLKEGAWSDLASGGNEEPDPVTTAFVLRALLEFEQRGVLHGLRGKIGAGFIESFKARGIYWLLEALESSEGLWVYKKNGYVSSRIYTQTAEILSLLPELGEFGDGEIRGVYKRLGSIWRDHDGLPAGPDESAPDIDASMHYLHSLNHSSFFRHEKLEFAECFLNTIFDRLEHSTSTVVGWNLLLQLVASFGPEVNLEEVQQHAKSFLEITLRHGRRKAVDSLPSTSRWARKIIESRIISRFDNPC